MAQGQTQGYVRLDQHMDYQARMQRLIARFDMEMRAIAADLEREARRENRQVRGR